MSEVKTKQYCVPVKVWVLAENAKHAEKVAVNSMNYLCGSDAPIAGFDIGEVKEGQEA